MFFLSRFLANSYSIKRYPVLRDFDRLLTSFDYIWSYFDVYFAFFKFQVFAAVLSSSRVSGQFTSGLSVILYLDRWIGWARPGNIGLVIETRKRIADMDGHWPRPA